LLPGCSVFKNHRREAVTETFSQQLMDFESLKIAALKSCPNYLAGAEPAAPLPP
jgi:hypothetical protein